MNDRQLRYALAVWRERSFSRAAERLGVSQPSLSEQVRNLEAALGFSLFDRTSRGVEASNAGRTFLQQASEVLTGMTGLEELARELKGAPESTIRIGVSAGIATKAIPIVVDCVSASEPPCRLDLVTATTRRVQRLVAQQRLDVGLILAGDAKAMPPGLVCETFATSPLMLLLSPDHALAREKEPVGLVQVATLKLILNEPRIGYDRAVLEAFEARGLTPNIVAVCDNLDSVKLMVSAGAGVALVPRIAIDEEIAAGTLAARSIEPAHEVMLLLVRREEPLPPRLARCAGELAHRLRARAEREPR